MNLLNISSIFLFCGAMTVATSGSVFAKDFRTTVGQRVFLADVRSPCSGGAAPDLSVLGKWSTGALQFGTLELGPAFSKASKRCKGRTLKMRKLYYRGTAKGKDRISIRWPDAGLIVWGVKVE